MMVIRQHRIYRQDIEANRDCLYIFGDNLDRQGFGGQAREMRGQENSFGIATKRSITHHYPNDYFFDHEDDVIPILAHEFARLLAHIVKKKINGNPYKAIIIPLDGIGTGLSKLPENAPKALVFINEQLNKLGTL